jgi:biotin operon repressor
MSFEAQRWAYEQNVTNSPITKAVLVNLCFRANDNGVCWPSINRIARDLDAGERTVKKHIAKLKRLGLIAVEKKKHGDAWPSNKYTIVGWCTTCTRVVSNVPLGSVPRAPRGVSDVPLNLNPNLNPNLRATKVARRGIRKEEPERLSPTDVRTGFDQVWRRLGGRKG